MLSAGGGLAPGVALSASTGAGEPMVNLLLKNINNAGTVLDLTYHPGVPCRERADAFDAATKAIPAIKVTSHEISIPGRGGILAGRDVGVARRQCQREGPVRDLQLL